MLVPLKYWHNLVAALKRVLLNRGLLFALEGFFVAVFIYCCIQDQYEKQLFSALAKYTKKNERKGISDDNDSLIVTSLHFVNALERQRAEIFSGKIESQVNSGLINAVADDLITARGSCGSYSIVLARLLKEMDIPVRIAQMKVQNEFGGHILIEARGNQGWVVLDPLYNLYFKTPEGRLASFSDIHADWAWYYKQVPDKYNSQYQYSDVRYTNWNKVPVVMPLTKGLLNLVYGKQKADEISLRSIFLRKFLFMSMGSLLITIFIGIVLVISYRRSRLQDATSPYRQSVIVPSEKIAV